MSNSTHRCEVVPVTLQPHGNADTLSVVEVWGYTCVVRTQDWVGVDRGVYIPPDSVVPDTEQFKFLEGKRRIKVAKLRGVISQGLLVKAPEGANIGDDVAVQLGITHYEPPMKARNGNRPGQDFEVGDNIPGPSGVTAPSYDLEAARRYASQAFTPGEAVWVTEKIHGANARFTFDGESMFVGSRNRWKSPDHDCIWNQALAKYPGIEAFCRAFPGTVLYGEVYGQVQDLTYGRSEVDFAAFDILTFAGHYMNLHSASDLCRANGIPFVPVLGLFPYDWGKMQEMAEGKSLVPGADNIREGICLRPFLERRDRNVGRHHLKLVGNGYYAR